jgi:hypothetical protein
MGNLTTKQRIPIVIKKKRKSGEDFMVGHNFRFIGEELSCRALCEVLQRDVLTNYRSPDIINPLTKKRLELDSYDPTTKIAIEYNGIQHYIFPNKFHKTQEEFDAQVARDKYKIRRCKELGIHLVSVPYTLYKSGSRDENYQRIWKFIVDNLREAKIVK